MPGTYIDAINLSADNDFRAKVRAALLIEAVNVLTESPEVDDHARRSAYAVQILRNVDAETPRVALIVSVVNPTIRAASPALPPDNDVQFVVNQLFSILSRV